MATLQPTNTPYKFVECTKQNLDTFPITEGCVYFTDTGEIYIDEGGKRKPYGISEEEKAQINANKNDILFTKNNCANAIKGKKTGTNVILNKISPIAHPIKCKVSNPNDVLKTHSFNLLDGNMRAKPRTDSGVTIAYNSIDNTYTFNGTCNAIKNITLYPTDTLIPLLKKGNVYRLKIKLISGNIIIPKGKYCVFNIYESDAKGVNNSQWISVNLPVDSNEQVETKQLSKNIVYATNFYCTPEVKFDNYKIQIQLELEECKDNIYVPYRTDSYSINDDGTVNNVISYYPNMVLTTGTGLSEIECEYNEDSNYFTGTITENKKDIINITENKEELLYGAIHQTSGFESDSTSILKTNFISAKVLSLKLKDSFIMRIYEYDNKKKFIKSVTGEKWVTDFDTSLLSEGCKFIKVAIKNIQGTNISDIADDILTTTFNYSDLIKLNKKTYCPFIDDDIFKSIAYSNFVDISPINTLEHFQLASHLGFNTIKGDIQMTSDGVLIMCHDDGYTLDSYGKIGVFSESNNTKWINSTWETVSKLEYYNLDSKMGHFAKVCTFEKYLKCCRDNDMFCYITVRDKNIDVIAKKIVDLLKEYRMENRSMINSFTVDTLKEFRYLSDKVALSHVLNNSLVPKKAEIDFAHDLRNTVVTLFWNPTKENIDEKWNGFKDVRDYAIKRGVKIYDAVHYHYNTAEKMKQKGVSGIQIAQAVLPYKRNDFCFVVKMVDNIPTFSDVLKSDRLIADISNLEGIVSVSNVRTIDNYYNYDNVLPVFWMNTLPYNLSVLCKENPNCSVKYENNKFILDTKNINGTYVITVNI